MAFAAGDVFASFDPWVSGIAYSNNVDGAVTTTLYGVDETTNSLVIVNPPNGGVLNTVGSLGVTTLKASMGFDISPTGTAYAAFEGANAILNLYSINLMTGAATFVGALGTGTTIGGIAIVP